MYFTAGRIGPLTIALAVLLAPGCAGRHGSMQWDTGAGGYVSTSQVLPGHRYYTAGSDTVPDAILALREDRPLRGGLWREVAMTPETLARLVDRMRGSRTEGPYGYAVLDDRGVRIGSWYSFFRPTPVKLLDDGGVLINPPAGDIQDLLRPPDDNRGRK